MFEFQRTVFSENEIKSINIVVTDKVINKANIIAKESGYLPYELTRKLELSKYYNNVDELNNISSAFSPDEIWIIDNKGNIKLKKQDYWVPIEYEHKAIRITSIFQFFENQFYIEITNNGKTYKWKLLNKENNQCILSSEPDIILNDYFEITCNILNNYINGL